MGHAGEPSVEEILASINAKLDAMRERERQVAAMLADGDNAAG